MRRLDRRSLPVHVLQRVGVVELDALDRAAGCHVHVALAALLEALEDLVGDLQVPGEIELAGLEDRARRRGGVASPLHLDVVEERTIGHVIIRVDLAADDVAGLEVHESIWPGADGGEIRGGLARLGAPVRVEEVLGDDLSSGAAERVEPVGRRVLEDHPSGMTVDLLDPLDVPVRGNGHGRGRGIGGVFPVEDEIVDGERLSVVPGDSALELPGHRLAVPRDGAFLQGWNLLGEDGEEIALRIERDERLVEDA